MKRYIRASKQPIINLEIVINVEQHPSRVAASGGLNYVNHPLSIKKSKRLSEAKLTILDDITGSMLSALRGAGFIILSTKQSKKSYSYYILCDIDPEGKFDYPLLQVKFRVADHRAAGLADDLTDTGYLFIKNIYIGPEEYSDPMKAILEFNKMCEDLSNGDISALTKYFTDRFSS